jgi:hypothetical protein
MKTTKKGSREKTRKEEKTRQATARPKTHAFHLHCRAVEKRISVLAPAALPIMTCKEQKKRQANSSARRRKHKATQDKITHSISTVTPLSRGSAFSPAALPMIIAEAPSATRRCVTKVRPQAAICAVALWADRPLQLRQTIYAITHRLLVGGDERERRGQRNRHTHTERCVTVREERVRVREERERQGD